MILTSKSLFIGLVLCAACLVQTASAQMNCDLDDPTAIADTLDPKGYYPLAIGNTWEYVSYQVIFGDPWRIEVVADTLIEGETFYKLRRTRCRFDVPTITEIASISYTYLRVTDSTFVYWSRERGSQAERHWLDQPFNTCFEGERSGNEWTITVTGAYDDPYTITAHGRATVTYQPEALKRIGYERSAVGGFEEYYGHGIGLVGALGEPSVPTDLVYAKVNGQEHGVPLDSLFVITVASEQPHPEPEGVWLPASYRLLRRSMLLCKAIWLASNSLMLKLAYEPKTSRYVKIPRCGPNGAQEQSAGLKQQEYDLSLFSPMQGSACCVLSRDLQQAVLWV